MLSTSFSQHGTQEIEAFAEYAKYLLQDEIIDSTYKIGFSTCIVTNKRLLVLEKFPKNVDEYYFGDIELIDYHTTLHGYRGLYAVFYLFGALFIFTFRARIWEKVAALIPASAKFFNFRPFFEMDLGTLLFVGYLSVYFCIDLFAFCSSFVGRLRIVPKDVGPQEIFSKYTPEVEELIDKIELHLESQHEGQKQDVH